MVLSTSPRKAVPLASGDDWEQSGSTSKVASITRRVFFCGVVVESEGGKAISEGPSVLLPAVAPGPDIRVDVQELVASLGEPLGSQSDTDTVRSRSLGREDNDNAVSRAVYMPTACTWEPFGSANPGFDLLTLPQTNKLLYSIRMPTPAGRQ
jgi:hypothetical protein